MTSNRARNRAAFRSNWAICPEPACFRERRLTTEGLIVTHRRYDGWRGCVFLTGVTSR